EVRVRRAPGPLLVHDFARVAVVGGDTADRGNQHLLRVVDLFLPSFDVRDGFDIPTERSKNGIFGRIFGAHLVALFVVVLRIAGAPCELISTFALDAGIPAYRRGWIVIVLVGPEYFGGRG